ncbi:MAG TPA: efflux RND transporter periplasmic adaptor subunit [Candidatus Acidoferrales bacterium]
MRKLFMVLAAGLALAIPLFIWMQRTPEPKRAESRGASGAASISGVQLAALGRVEGRGETISVGAATDGVVKEVFVTAGQEVSKGALLAAINCDDIGEEVDLAKAQADSARDARTRLLRGDRDEERAAAVQATDAAKAVMMQAQDHLNRMNALYQKQEISRDTFDQANRDFEVAQANYEKTEDEQKLADADPLPEEVSRANAEVRAAERAVRVAMDKVEKCNVRAPISGTILKVLTKAGESYSTLLPHPLFTISDESVRRVRAEVDERDIARLKIGQASIVTADAFPGQKFEGQVVEIAQAMGPKSVMSDDASQEIDQNVLDVVIQLKPAKEELPIGLRVTAEMTGVTTPVEQSVEAPTEPPTTSLPIETTASNREVAAAPGAPAVHAEATAEESAAGAGSATSVTLSNTTGFLLQAGAMTHPENADALAASLQKKSFPAFVATRKGDPFYRVDVGPYPTLAAATDAKNALSNGGFETILKHRMTEAAQ